MSRSPSHIALHRGIALVPEGRRGLPPMTVEQDPDPALKIAHRSDALKKTDAVMAGGRQELLGTRSVRRACRGR
jgi:ABC-type branched-subunit amino acid transport system ATPase component